MRLKANFDMLIPGIMLNQLEHGANFAVQFNLFALNRVFIGKRKQIADNPRNMGDLLVQRIKRFVKFRRAKFVFHETEIGVNNFERIIDFMRHARRQ